MVDVSLISQFVALHMECVDSVLPNKCCCKQARYGNEGGVTKRGFLPSTVSPSTPKDSTKWILKMMDLRQSVISSFNCYLGINDCLTSGVQHLLVSVQLQLFDILMTSQQFGVSDMGPFKFFQDRSCVSLPKPGVSARVTIHVWYILPTSTILFYLYLTIKNQPDVGKYASPMGGRGSNPGGKGSVQLEPRKSTLALPLDHRSLGRSFKVVFPEDSEPIGANNWGP